MVGRCTVLCSERDLAIFFFAVFEVEHPVEPSKTAREILSVLQVVCTL